MTSDRSDIPTATLVDGLVVTSAQRAALVQALERGRLPQVAVALTRVVFGASDWNRARAAERHVRRLLLTARARSIRALEREYRSRRFFTAFGADATVSRASFAVWRGLGDSALGALAIGSVQRTGWVREQAVAELGVSRAAPACGLLLVRLNDPVRAIIRRARQALESWLSFDHLDTLARYLPLVDGMTTWIRTARAKDDIPQRIYRLLAAHPRVLITHTSDDDPDVRHSCYQLIFRTRRGQPDIARFLRAALGDRAPGIRHLAAERILDPSWTPTSIRPALLADMGADRSPRIRARALRWLAKQPDAEAHVRRAVFDRNANVRFLARRYARRLELGIQYRARAMDALTDETSDRDALVAALATLSDHGRQADCGAVIPFLTHPLIRVRKEAQRTARILECPDCAEE